MQPHSLIKHDPDLPKVLIVGQPFNDETGGGITLSNLFSGWDSNKIAVVCSAYLINQNTDREACSHYYQIGEKEHKWIFPFSLFKRKYKSGPLNRKQAQLMGQPSAPNWRKKLISDFLYPTLSFLGVSNFLSSTSLSPELCEWLDEYKPDVVYAQASSLDAVIFCKKIQQYLKVPFVFHMMDDWPAYVKEEGLLGAFWYKKVHKEFKSLFERSDLLLSISEEMAAEYKKRYGKDFITFHNPISINFWKSNRRIDFSLAKQPSILYAGRVGTGIDSSLEIIARSVQKINEENIPLTFILQTPEKPLWSEKYKCVVHRNLIPYNELPKTFAASDILILPYDFSVKSFRFIRFSMPTKAPEYMASGSPVIIFAPEETALVEYASRYDCAKIVTTNDPIVLNEAIKELLKDQELRRTLSEKASKTVDEHHNSTEVKNKFKSLICSLVENRHAHHNYS